MAYSDYIASRVLLNSELLVQGAILASTAVEKYFKAVLAFRGNESHGHLKKAHFNAVKSFDSRLYASLNEEFLLLLQKTYHLRYTDELQVGFNLVIAQRELLAELDYTATTLQDSFQLQVNGKDACLAYHQGKKQADTRLLANNHMAAGVTKNDFISATPQRVYEIRKCPLRGVFEMHYQAENESATASFCGAA
jgi:hypothetical protein